MSGREPLLQVRNLRKHFPLQRGWMAGGQPVVRAVDGVSFELAAGRTLGVVGESGCGKSTLGRCLVRLESITDGTIELDGHRIDRLPERILRRSRQRLQMVFQDPFASLNPRRRVGESVAEPLVNFGLARGRALEQAVRDWFVRVGLPADGVDRYPHEFSGGQRQRIGIARALAVDPDLVVLDEPVSALDVSVQAQIINLLADLQAQLGVAYLFIAHDLAVVEHISDTVAVMYLGRIVELAERHNLFSAPRHPYTRSLLSAVPVADPDQDRRRIILQGDLPSPVDPPSGCRFRTRCPIARSRCATEDPPLQDVDTGHRVACHYPVTGPLGAELNGAGDHGAETPGKTG